MKRLAIASGLACLFAAPAFAQMEVTCGDYALMDNAKQMETVAELETQTSEMSKENQLTADQIHEKLAAECKDKVDVLIIDIVAGK